MTMREKQILAKAIEIRKEDHSSPVREAEPSLNL